MNTHFSTLSPSWDLPRVKAYTILAVDADLNSLSFGRFAPFDLGCRKRLEQLVKPDHATNWLLQVHGNRLVELPLSRQMDVEADGSYTFQKRTVCAVLTADCLPIVFSNLAGTQVGVVHAGRKGLQNGIVSTMVKAFQSPPTQILAWIGPGIAAESYPISPEIKAEVLALSTDYERLFKETDDGSFLMDLYEMARMQLGSCGLLKEHISGAAWNTFSDTRFHSARRDKDLSGRMATVVWMD